MKKILFYFLLLTSNFALARLDLAALNNTSWQREDVTGLDYTLYFNSLSPDAGTIWLRGQTPCEPYIAKMNVQSGTDRVSIGLSSVSTADPCDKQAATDNFLDSMRRTVGLQSGDDELVFLDQNQQALLSFRKVDPVFTKMENTFWVDGERFKNVYFSAHLFSSDKSLESYLELIGRPGCMDYHGRVIVAGVAQSPRALGIPMVWCVNVIEAMGEVFDNWTIALRSFSEIFSKTAEIHLNENRLSFVDGEHNEIINFKRLPALFVQLHGTSWEISDEQLRGGGDGFGYLAGDTNTISFTLDSGSLLYDATLCDEFSGDIMYQDGKAVVGPSFMSRFISCSPVRRRLCAIFEKTADIRVQGNSLHFLDANNIELITFIRKPDWLVWPGAVSPKR